MLADWPLWARREQLPPSGNHWHTWLMLGGRGAGKTRAGAEWLRAVAMANRHFTGHSGGRLALVGQTFQDVRAVMIEGESGLLAVHPRDERPQWIASRRLLIWPNGVTGHVFSANDPDGLRGNQFGAAWCDELAKWNALEATWDMLQFCMRLGRHPLRMVTTTPRPVGLLKRMLADSRVALTRSSTRANAANLAPGFIEFVEAEYGGTRLGRQELEGELVEDREDALFSRSQIEASRLQTPPPLRRIVVAVDPPASSHASSDLCGIVAAGQDAEGTCHVIADESFGRATPEQWARRVAALYHRLGADCVVAEVNQGGDMVASVLGMTDASIPVRPVRATRGKWIRAEPVALLYARGRVLHAGTFPQLEDQMCDFGPDGLSGSASPDRLDALVWAIHELALKPAGRPRIRHA